MVKQLFLLQSFILFIVMQVNSQSYVDIVNYNNQNFFSHYNDSANSPVYIQDNLLNIFIPKQLKNDNVLLFRVSSEKAVVKRDGPAAFTENLFSISVPVGFVFVSKNKVWKHTFIFIPKVNSDLRDDLKHDFQYGGIGLFTYVKNDRCQFKFGMYYNREFWGNFFLPLLGIDWKINDKWQLYGVMPSNLRLEYRLAKNWFTGLGWRSFQRSFRLSQPFNNDFVWVKENQLKAFFEGYIYKNLVLSFDVYNSITYELSRNDYSDVNQKKSGLSTFEPFQKNFGFTIGFAYRIKTGKQEPETK